MNAIENARDTLGQAGRNVARRFPLTLRTLELVIVAALYIGGLVFVDQLSGKAHFPVAVYAMFVMPVVLSIGLRWYRALERRLGIHEGTLPKIG